jgi:hypothetical protein
MTTPATVEDEKDDDDQMAGQPVIVSLSAALSRLK